MLKVIDPLKAARIQKAGEIREIPPEERVTSESQSIAISGQALAKIMNVPFRNDAKSVQALAAAIGDFQGGILMLKPGKPPYIFELSKTAIDEIARGTSRDASHGAPLGASRTWR